MGNLPTPADPASPPPARDTRRPFGGRRTRAPAPAAARPQPGPQPEHVARVLARYGLLGLDAEDRLRRAELALAEVALDLVREMDRRGELLDRLDEADVSLGRLRADVALIHKTLRECASGYAEAEARVAAVEAAQ